MREQHMLTEVDQVRLRELLDHLTSIGVRVEHADLLTQRVKQARVVTQRSIPRDVVTMNSMFAVRDLDANERWSCLLAYPQDASPVDRKVSVAAPLGAMLLGQRVGDTVEYPVSWGTRQLRIERLYYQPEASGDYHLRSSAGRYTSGGWIVDVASSPAIDAGDPASDYSLETTPNGGRINLGAYGNTAEASRSGGATTGELIFGNGFE